MRLELRCPGTFTLNLERWSENLEGGGCLFILHLLPSMAFICLFLPSVALISHRFMRSLYMMGVLFRIVLGKFEVNLSCRLIFNSVGTFNMSVRS